MVCKNVGCFRDLRGSEPPVHGSPVYNLIRSFTAARRVSEAAGFENALCWGQYKSRAVLEIVLRDVGFWFSGPSQLTDDVMYSTVVLVALAVSAVTDRLTLSRDESKVLDFIDNINSKQARFSLPEHLAVHLHAYNCFVSAARCSAEHVCFPHGRFCPVRSERLPQHGCFRMDGALMSRKGRCTKRSMAFRHLNRIGRRTGCSTSRCVTSAEDPRSTLALCT